LAYFFYDPAIAHLSPGVANVLRCVELARDVSATHVYLGYKVEGCPSLKYKANFRPHELLDGRPSLTEQPVWHEQQ
jgi:arginine-tRNA-protein transferase